MSPLLRNSAISGGMGGTSPRVWNGGVLARMPADRRSLLESLTFLGGLFLFDLEVRCCSSFRCFVFDVLFGFVYVPFVNSLSFAEGNCWSSLVFWRVDLPLTLDSSLRRRFSGRVSLFPDVC